MRRFLICMFLMFLIGLYGSLPVFAESLKNSMIFKVTIVEKGKELEWEYVNPNEYEVEIENQVIKDERAEREIEELFHKLAISKTRNVNDMLNVLKENGYHQIERLDIRWITAEEELYTWVWNKK